jgi:hypothetical protein
MSQLNLVDLAGSEKAGQTGAEGARYCCFSPTHREERQDRGMSRPSTRGSLVSEGSYDREMTRHNKVEVAGHGWGGGGARELGGE